MRTGAIHPASALTVKITTFRRGQQIGFGTGFLVVSNIFNCIGLLTCWHVLTGRSASNPEQLLPGYPDSPDLIKFKFIRRDFSNTVTIERGLYNNDGQALWLENSFDGQRVDAALIPLKRPDIPLDACFNTSDIPDQPDARISVGSSVVILGFPVGVPHQNIYPIWKRGMIASEPNLRDDSRNFFIDATTRSGMSGGPVYAVINSPYITESGTTALDAGGPWYRHLGLYSSHFATKDSLPEIGVVWRSEFLPSFDSPGGKNPIPPEPPFSF